MIDTKQKILDSAERLFAAHGYAAVSLRQIIAEAGVNLAAIHYHFGSKEEVLDQVVMRKGGPVNEERLARLDKLDAETGGKPPVDRILEAFLKPMAEAAVKHPNVSRMIGRLQAEGMLTQVLGRNFQPVLARLFAALRRALPHLSDDEFGWRLHFLQGAIAHTMCADPAAFFGADDSGGVPVRIERLIAFLAGGLQAPATAKTHATARTRTGK